ncbi:hypothetical protein A3D14_03230 [Candidatus Saccharibacteria bacterium RIFCSPHIGHO2_02_FULL_47_12]|nr:MAG: hypothetical protein A3D14_03230 [Candidatus Saccharibacteria bacterium RIFCSPHIGHO2_02_FULL_47_12]
MPSPRTFDANGIEFKKIGLDQYDYYDDKFMLKNISKYDKRIGSLLIEFGELEHLLDSAIAFIISDRSDDNGLRIIMDMSYRQKVELYNRLCKIYLNVAGHTSKVAKLKLHMKNLISAGEARNLVAHAKWMSLDEEGFVRTKASMDEEAFIEFKYYRLTPQVLYNQERKLSKITTEFYAFLESINQI